MLRCRPPRAQGNTQSTKQYSLGIDQTSGDVGLPEISCASAGETDYTALLLKIMQGELYVAGVSKHIVEYNGLKEVLQVTVLSGPPASILR